MTVPPDQQIPDPHRRTLPHVAINEQGMRELEIWIKGFLAALSGIFFGRKNRGRWLDIETTNGTNSPSGFDAYLHGDTLFLFYNTVTTDGNAWNFRTEGGGFQESTSGGGYQIDTGDSDTGGGGYTVNSHGGGQDFTTNGGGWDVDTGDPTTGNTNGGLNVFGGNTVINANGDLDLQSVPLNGNSAGVQIFAADGDVSIGAAIGAGGGPGDITIQGHGQLRVNIQTAGQTLAVNDHLGNPILTMADATGVTTGSFDGGSA